MLNNAMPQNLTLREQKMTYPTGSLTISPDQNNSELSGGVSPDLGVS
ncbi:MAG: hypothetical protein Q8Q90_01465 [bacterium]|nr:hypothetical protein [bacterium]